MRIDRETKIAVVILWLIGFCCIAFSFTGCGSRNVTIDSELIEYLHRFERDIGVSSEDISAVFATLDKTVAARCIRMGDERTIEVDRVFWDKASENSREETMYHELGHCALYLDHNNALLPSKCPVSIMYQYIFGNGPCYYNNKPYYFWQLTQEN